MGEFVSRSERQRKERLERKRQKNDNRSPSAFDWVKAIVVALILAVVIRGFFLEPTYVQGPSMLNTMQTGDKVIINKLIYRFKSPARGEIIVFHTQGEKDLIKRIIGLPGETIQVKNSRVYINGKMLSEPYLSFSTQTSTVPPTKIAAGHLFVMGDNRANSADSRDLGPIPIDQIVGRAEFIYWPISKWKSL
ncbi:signal peptidase I [Shimazuella alba]|jgi:signal peptidase I|uniref:Signal peptidase I n=1 Tax=Shimazuella alba TaxID=2690964 RepID=A0A6I4VSK6_9BACL|nr:signal peptidase I [Shimazuella alba]MXQ53205.1 signal peptidase I [Shimazuella alba]